MTDFACIKLGLRESSGAPNVPAKFLQPCHVIPLSVVESLIFSPLSVGLAYLH